jgi:hypothetical protein
MLKMRDGCHLAALCFLFSAVVGCGGGGSTESTAVSVNAGSDLTLDEQVEFTLSAVASPAGGTFTWRQLSGPLVDASFPLTGQAQTLTAPNIKADSVMVFSVEYRAADNSAATDTVSVNLTSKNQAPIATITQTAPETLPAKFGDTIILSAESSSDPDNNGTIVSYQWQQTAGSDLGVSQLSASKLSFVHPQLEQNQQVTFSLTVTDDEGAAASTEFSITLQAAAELVVAKAGDDKNVFEFASVELDGSASQVITTSFTCVWQQTKGISLTLDDATACKTNFIAPDIDKAESVQFKLTVTDEKNRTADDLITIQINPQPLGLINDTGMQDCYDNAQVYRDCDNIPEEYQGQDAEFGRDNYASLLDKIGQGSAGFDYTKLDQFAGELPDSATSFACIRDNVTGLIWEVKEASSGTLPATSLRENQNNYSWYYTGEGNGKVDGTLASPRTSCPSYTDCGLETFVAEVNAQNYCGGNNWRVPTHKELMGLLNFAKQGQNHLLNSEFFPNLPSQQINGYLPYWTIESSAEGAERNFAWAIDMLTGTDIGYPKDQKAYIRLVRTP